MNSNIDSMITNESLRGLGAEGSKMICMGILGVCATCHAPKAEKRCSKCLCVCYCSKKCQKKGWNSSGNNSSNNDSDGQHKHVCSILAQARLPEWEDAARLNSREKKLCIPKAASSSKGSKTKSNDDALLWTAQGMDLFSGKVGILNGGELSGLPDGPADVDKGVALLYKAARAGSKAAQYQCALFALNDDENKDKVLHWLKLAAHNGHAEAMVTYGNKYWFFRENNHEYDPVQALVWVRRGLALGASELPDPAGNRLSSSSFSMSMGFAVQEGRKLYLRGFMAQISNEEDDDSASPSFDTILKLAASCGCVSAIAALCPDST